MSPCYSRGSELALLTSCGLGRHLNASLLQPFSFAAREYLRPMLVGKLVQYNITHAVEGSKTGSNVSCFPHM